MAPTEAARKNHEELFPGRVSTLAGVTRFWSGEGLRPLLGLWAKPGHGQQPQRVRSPAARCRSRPRLPGG